MTDTLPLFPLSRSLFPDGRLPLQIFEVRYLDLMRKCHAQQLPFGVVGLQQGKEVQTPGESPTLHAYGCVAHLREFQPVQANFFKVVAQGGLRFRLVDVQPGPLGVWQGQVQYLPADPEVSLPAPYQHLADHLGRYIAEAQRQGVGDQLPFYAPYVLDQCGWVANRYAQSLPISGERQIELLQELDPVRRLEAVAGLT